MNIAIIPARGGSKRIPRKNIKDFCGRPIIAYSIEAAIKSNLFDEVMVSTDDEEIKSIAIALGAKVPFMRSPENSDDYATTADVISEVLAFYGEVFEFICCIYPTAPFVSKLKLTESFDKICSTHSDSLIPIAEFSYPPQRSLCLKDEKLRMNNPENLNVRSQDLDVLYHDIGQFYWIKTSSFMKTKTILGEDTTYLKVSQLEVQDIDTEIDWKIAEIKYQVLVIGNGI